MTSSSHEHPTGLDADVTSHGGYETHFEEMATTYATARPPYPQELYMELERAGVIGPALRVLEIGAGAGLGTRELVAAGCDVVAIEPGTHLAHLLSTQFPGVQVLCTTLEGSTLEDTSFDSVAAATSMHWVDLDLGLPKVHAALRPGGHLAVWRHVFGNPAHPTDFRDRVARIVAARGPAFAKRPEEPPSMAALAAGGRFAPLQTRRWQWSVELTSDQIRQLFATFSDWSPTEVDAAGEAADELEGQVTEHYQTVLHLLRKVDSGT